MQIDVFACGGLQACLCLRLLAQITSLFDAVIFDSQPLGGAERVAKRRSGVMRSTVHTASECTPMSSVRNTWARCWVRESSDVGGLWL